MTLRPRCLVAFVVGAVVLGASPSAFAQPKADKAVADQRAKELFAKGDTAYAEGRYDEALAAFEEAYELSQRPQLLFNVANSLERLGKYAEAMDALEKYLASGKAHDKDTMQKRLANLKKRVEDQRREEKAAREEEEKRQREAEEKRKAEEARRASDPSAPPPRVLETKPEGPSKTVPIVLLATGGAALVAGGVFGVLTLSARSDAKNACSDASGPSLCQSDARSALDREKTFGLVADVSLLAGVVLAGVGTYLLVKGSSTPKSRAALPVRVVTTKSGGGLELVGSF